jgi:formamidopyrimidine-DNA glycosylase
VPELPDIVVYLESLAPRVLQQPLQRVRVASPFLLRSVDPPLGATHGKRVVGLSRLGKRLVFALEDDLFLVLHLMIAGRLRWRPPGTRIQGKVGLAAFDFPTGTLLLTEASSRKRASLHVARGEAAVRALAPSGLEIFEADRDAFAAALTRERHTLKRALTDPRLFSGIGNAYSDAPEEVDRLFAACRAVLTEWTDRLRRQVGTGFPEKVTAFHDAMAVHGKYRQPCPVCGAPVQRIVHAENETNYCARCQTGGKLLADRALSKLLHDDWPRSLDELEERVGRGPERTS